MRRPAYLLCLLWTSLALAQYIEGSIRSNQWEDKDGNRQKSYDIVVRFIRMLSPTPNGNSAKPKGGNATQPFQPSEEDNPFNQNETSEVPF